MHGSDVCSAHGGRAPQVKAAAKRRLAAAEMTKAAASYGLPLDVDPGEALLDEIRWTAGHVLWLREIVQNLPREEVAWGITEEADRQATEFAGTDTIRKATPNVWVVLYQQERKHLVDVCAVALKVGIEERRVRLAEQQAQVIADLIRSLLEDEELGLDPRQKEIGRAVASRHLRLLGGAA